MVKTLLPISVTYLAVLLFAVALSSCQIGESSPPNVLIIAVDGMNYDDIRCSSTTETEISAFRTLCRESVRFTHAFSPSALSQPSLVSLLTGKYPFEAQVWNNEDSHLVEGQQTVAEQAYSSGYQTAFFSGGPPIWSRSGINQGFDLFVDVIKTHAGDLFRPVRTQVMLLKNWIDAHSSKPKFVVIHLADLQFPDSATSSFDGIERESTVKGQLKELDEKIGHLFEWLKEEDYWDNHFIAFVGLRARTDELREGYGRVGGVFAENTQVPVFIKPNRRPRDLGLQWNVDMNITLADLGRTLANLVGLDAGLSPLTISLLPVVRDTGAKTDEKRSIYIESGWPAWHGFGSSVFALRSDRLLYIHDEKSSLFNSLVDRSERIPLDPTDPRAEKLVQEAKLFWGSRGVEPFRPIAPIDIDKYELARELFGEDKFGEKSLARAILRKRPNDEDVFNWMAYLSVIHQDWRELQRMGRRAKNDDWVFVARNNLDRRTIEPKSPCLQLEKPISDCDDLLARDLRTWMDSRLEGKRRERAREKFIRQMSLLKIRREIEQRNFVNGMLWFHPSRSSLKPIDADLLLALPVNQARKKIVDLRLAN